MTAESSPVASGRSRLASVSAHLREPLYRTGYLLTISTAISALLGFVFWTVAAHRYNVHTIGIDSATIAAMAFVSSIAQGGLGVVLVRYVPVAGPDRRRLILGVYAVTTVASILLAAAAALTAPLWSASLGRLAHDPLWFLGFVAATALWTVFSLQDVVLTGMRAAHIVPLENISYAIAKLALVFGLSALSPAAGPFIAWNAPGAVGVAVISWIIFRRLIPSRSRTEAQTPLSQPTGLPDARTVRSAAVANLSGGLFNEIATFLTPVIVVAMVGADREAYFYPPWVIMVALNAITVATMSALTVEAAREPDMAYVMARRSLIQTLLMLIPVLLVLLVGAPLILHLYGGHYARAGTGLMRILALSLIPSAVSSIGLGLARVLRRNRVVAATLALPSVIQVALTVLLIHPLGLVAVGWGQLAGDGLAALALGCTLMRPVFGSRSQSPPA